MPDCKLKYRQHKWRQTNNHTYFLVKQMRMIGSLCVRGQKVSTFASHPCSLPRTPNLPMSGLVHKPTVSIIVVNLFLVDHGKKQLCKMCNRPFWNRKQCLWWFNRYPGEVSSSKERVKSWYCRNNISGIKVNNLAYITNFTNMTGSQDKVGEAFVKFHGLHSCPISQIFQIVRITIYSLKELKS